MLSNTCPQLLTIPKFVNNNSHHRRNIQTFNDLLLLHVLCAGLGQAGGRKFTRIRLTLTPVSMFTLPDKEFTRNFQTSSGLAAGSREMAASAAASAGCAVILEEASEGEEGDPAAAPPPPSSAPPSLLHSLSVPGHVQDTPYHKLRRASHHIISGRRICINCYRLIVVSIDKYIHLMKIKQ